MSAILIGLSTTYGLQGVFIASFLSGCMLIIASLFKFGKIVSLFQLVLLLVLQVELQSLLD